MNRILQSIYSFILLSSVCSKSIVQPKQENRLINKNVVCPVFVYIWAANRNRRYIEVLLKSSLNYKTTINLRWCNEREISDNLISA